MSCSSSHWLKDNNEGQIIDFELLVIIMNFRVSNYPKQVKNKWVVGFAFVDGNFIIKTTRSSTCRKNEDHHVHYL